MKHITLDSLNSQYEAFKSFRPDIVIFYGETWKVIRQEKGE